MTSRRFASLFFISLLFLLNCFSYPSSAVSVSHSDPKKVSLDLYYESLCPSCSNFIVNYLADVFENGLITIIDLKLVPYGNARVRSNGTIICQHGPYECFLNTVEACAINVWPDLNKHFSFIYCVEGLVLKKKYMEWESCFKKLGFDRKPIADCYNGGYGRKIELQYAEETDDLKPPHKYVPWVVVDGKPLYEDYVNYITYVCKAYKGDSVPNACKESPLKFFSKEEENRINQVCYMNKETSSPTTKIRSVATSLGNKMKETVSI